MEIVVGLNLSNPNPKVWNSSSPYFLPEVRAVMVSYAEFDKTPTKRKKAMEVGLHQYLEVPKDISIYLDNGSFSFLRRSSQINQQEYKEFIERAKPDWYPTPQDFIPAPAMSDGQQYNCMLDTMKINLAYNYDGFVPVLHICRYLNEYVTHLQGDHLLNQKKRIALGGIVPNLLRAPKAMPYQDILGHLQNIRKVFKDKKIHVFGIGGTATLHIAALLQMDSIDSTGWRNRAARGIIQLPGKGDRLVAELGKWRGRNCDENEWDVLTQCGCPSCRNNGIEGLKIKGLTGFMNRAAHNLWVLLEEDRLIKYHLLNNSYSEWYPSHVSNSTYKPLIDYLIKEKQVHTLFKK
ncbi:hypothetical protein AAE02nite_38200 [Adhaeribacter aerolatus]|uniref:tRNA-guanine(15) transglycosylase-like domain-containing protein n=1 Tax=Adhaeribacter aerolatus TaxID=670289 RepID=A0A512B2G4_9BACT|nr:hypothetical protein [Adhaeribacter aerolatus]GEO06156.1 hypothetical protein AAE02nite_38200 [Adhaeribacter aerolatus]